MQKTIVTGGAGFIGANLVDKLINMGVEVHIIDDLSTGFEKNINPKATFHKIDISTINPELAWYEFKNTDVIFHTAALARVQPSIEDPIPFDNVNVSGTLRMLKLAHNLGVKRFVYSASSSCYGNNKNFLHQKKNRLILYPLMVCKNILENSIVKCLVKYII